MPVEFLTDEQAAGYGRFPEGLTPTELEGLFFLDDSDRMWWSVAAVMRTGSGLACSTVVAGTRPRVSASCNQASYRAAARAERIRVKLGSSIADKARHAVASEATGPNRSGCWRSTPRSAIVSPPSAFNTARSTATRPGSCAERRCQSSPNA